MVAALVGGNSIRATVCITGVAKNTIVKLLAELGEACAGYQGEHLVICAPCVELCHTIIITNRQCAGNSN